MHLMTGITYNCKVEDCLLIVERKNWTIPPQSLLVGTIYSGKNRTSVLNKHPSYAVQDTMLLSEHHGC